MKANDHTVDSLQSIPRLRSSIFNPPGYLSIFSNVSIITKSTHFHSSSYLLPILFLAMTILCLATFDRKPTWASESAVGKIVKTTGFVQVRDSHQHLSTAIPELKLYPRWSLRTGNDGWAAILMADESMIQLHRNSFLFFKSINRNAGWLKAKPVSASGNTGSFYKLNAGEMWLRNKNERVNINIETPTVSAGIRGTEINIRIEESGTVLISIIEGYVEASNRYGRIRAGTSELIIAQPGAAPVKRMLLTPEDAVQWTIYIPPLFDYRSFQLTGGGRQLLQQKLEMFLKQAASKPMDTQTAVRLGEIYRDLGKRPQARQYLEKALKDDPLHPEALTALGWTVLDDNRVSEALALFKRVKIPLPETYLGIIAGYLRLGQTEKAMFFLQRAHRDFPLYSPLRLQKALIDLRFREVIRARKVLAEIIARDPTYAAAYSLLSLVLLAQGQKEQAIAAGEKAVSSAPENTNAQVILSYAYQAAFDLPRARSILGRALEQDPDNVLALLSQARLLFGSDYNKEASHTIEKAYRLAPSNPDVQNLRAFLLLAGRKTDEAVSAFKETIKLDPSMGEPHMGLALAYMRKGKAPEALQSICSAVLLEPRKSSFLSYWGKMLYQIERFDRALQALETAQQLDTRDPTPHLYKALILRDLNRPTAAIESLNKAVSLNDNLAVYRSRFLLDRDLSVKNINQSIVYSQLGLSDWARSRALASVENDYNNSAGHIFLAGALLSMTDRLRAGSSENMLGLLLQPANLNSFNTFQRYTQFFESPGADVLLNGFVGTQGSYGGDIISYGNLPSLNLAFNSSANYSETDGWRGTDYFDTKGVIGSLKWDPTPQDGFLMMGNYAELDEGDTPETRYEVDAPSRPLNYNNNKAGAFTFGYHHHFSPDSDFLFLYQYRKTNVTFFSRTESDFTLNPDFLLVSDLNSELDLPYHQVQPHLLKRIGNHQLILGSLQYWRNKENQSRIDDILFLKTEPDQAFIKNIRQDISIRTSDRFQSYYIQDIWDVRPNFSLQAAVYYDAMDLSNVFTETEWDQNIISPRFGMVWKISRNDTLRFAAFRYLLAPAIVRLDPTNIAGVPLLRNATEGTKADEVDVVWEHEWRSGYLWATGFYQDNEKYEKLSTETDLTSRGRLKGASLGLNQLLIDGLGLAANYYYQEISSSAAPLKDRQDHLATLGLIYLHPSGLFGGIKQLFRYEDFETSDRENEKIWITDINIGFQFPEKRGGIELGINNLFNHKYNWVTDFFVFRGRVPEREISAKLSLFF